MINKKSQISLDGKEGIEVRVQRDDSVVGLENMKRNLSKDVSTENNRIKLNVIQNFFVITLLKTTDKIIYVLEEYF